MSDQPTEQLLLLVEDETLLRCEMEDFLTGQGFDASLSRTGRPEFLSWNARIAGSEPS
jgi:hypothetical protein